MTRPLCALAFLLMLVASAHAQNSLSGTILVGGQTLFITTTVNASGSVSTPSPAATPTPGPVATPTPGSTPAPTATPTPYGPAGYPLSPHNEWIDPKTSYGAVGNGITNDLVAFQNAIDAGNVYVSSPGTYLLNGTGYNGVNVPSNRTLQCAPGVILKTTRHDNIDSGIVMFKGVGSSALLGCTLVGTNIKPILDSNQGNYGVEVEASSFITLGGNICANVFGNSCFHVTAGGSTASDHITVTHNDFERTGLYGTAIIQGSNCEVSWNIAHDASMGDEANVSTNRNGDNIWENNSISRSLGNGYGDVFLSGGVAAGADYSTDAVRTNIVSGSSMHIYETCDSSYPTCRPATYSGNSCTGGCSVH
jgi:hypothetical protein